MTRPKLDSYDLRILEVLQRDGRVSKVKLAEAVHLTPSPCWERLRKLEEAGVIAGYHARIDPRKLGPTTTVMVEVALGDHRAADFERFERAVRGVPEIVECWAIGGGMDYFCKVMVRHLADYQNLIERLLASEIGIKRYYSYVVTMPIKNEPIPVALLVQDSP